MKSKTHAAQRMQERYGIEMSGTDMIHLRSRMIGGQGVLLDRQPSSGCERRLVCVKGQDVIVLWSPDIERILSILPRKRAFPEWKRRKGVGKSRREGKRPEPDGEVEAL